MLEFLRDPVWQFIGALFGFIAIFFAWRQRRNKSLSYKIIANSPLFSVNDEISGRLRVLFDEKPVEDIYLIVVKIFNSGNISIKSSDYEYPVNFNFGKKTKLLSAEVIEKKPPEMQISTSIDGTRVLLTPTLMNENDSVTVKLLADQFNGQILVEGRIVGIKAIKESVEGKFSDTVIPLIIGVLVGIVSAHFFLHIMGFELVNVLILISIQLLVAIGASLSLLLVLSKP
ncbi:MAG: hypothetical protein SVJ22_09535 [Halobacteriota archaeon]|nr:hypothetical protein [Halobacteriota archaeon]